jgi:Uma2 family endonuclease
MLSQNYTPISEDDYRRLELHSPVRHEYVKGEVFATTGGTLRHNVISLNVAAALRTGLHNTPCRVFINDVRVRVAMSSAYYYPDVVVACAREGRALDLVSGEVEDAILIVEVLSEGTEGVDRREKLLAYRTLPSLSEYALVSQD